MAGSDAEQALFSSFANQRWAAAVAAARPFVDVSALLASADSAWAGLAADDWLQAFAAHPRIGESGGHSPRQSEREQSRVLDAPAPTLAALTAENRLYEERFGHVFLIAAQGRGAGEILDALRQRMGNSPAVELGVAAAEQRKITRLRLEQLCRS